MKHTSTPWTLNLEVNHATIYCGNLRIAELEETGGLKAQYKANAAFIVTACNSHDALIEALKAVEHWQNTGDHIKGATLLKVREALTLAGVKV